MSATTLHRPDADAATNEQEIRQGMRDIARALGNCRDGRRSRLSAMFRAAADVPADRWPAPVRLAVRNVIDNPLVPIAITLMSGAAGAAEFRATARA